MAKVKGGEARPAPAKKKAAKKKAAKKKAAKKSATPKASSAVRVSAKAPAAKVAPSAAKKAGSPAGDDALDAAWARAHEELRTAGAAKLPKGASEAAIQRAEKALGVALPDDFRASYKRHDGGGSEYILEGREFLSLEGIVRQWRIWKDLYDSGTFEDTNSEPARGVKDDWWNPKWIPFTYDGSGNHHCIDLDPGKGGRLGQVILMWHDSEERPVEAKSFSDFLKKASWGPFD